MQWACPTRQSTNGKMKVACRTYFCESTDDIVWKKKEYKVKEQSLAFFKVNGILYTDQWSEKEVRMSRNKYPEETEKKILDAAYELFVERGYENTSIQNIIDRTALSKGAIYHHFESKESILLAVFRRVAESIAMESRKVVETKDMTGRQKIQKIFQSDRHLGNISLIVDDKKQMQLVHAMPNLLESPHILALYLKITMEEITPRYLYPVIQGAL